MKLTRFVLGLSLISSLTAIGQSSKINFVQYELKNGLRVILHEDHSTPIVAVSVLYHVGSKNENPDKTGFAHFFEHLMFEGSNNMERGEYMKLVQSNGGVLNANTSFDRTYYFEVLPSNQTELGLWLESERMLHAKVDQKGIETQREVVKEERRQRMDNRPYGKLLEETYSRAFKEHPYKWPTIGSMEHLNAAKEADYVNFYKTFYVPNNAVLSIAGDINVEQTKKWIAKYFETIPRGNIAINRPNINAEPLQTKEVRDTVYDNVQLPAVIMAYKQPAQGTADFYALQMLTKVLSDGASSRMNKELVDKQQLAVAAGAFPIPTEHPGLTLMFSIANMGKNAAQLETGMQEQIDLIKKNLISDEEFNKIRNQVENEFVSENTKMAGLAENLANYLVYFGDANLVNTELERYMKVTRDDIKAVANKYFNNSNRVVLYWLPKAEKK